MEGLGGGAGERRASSRRACGGFEIAGELGLAARDAGAAKGFHRVEKLVAGLLAENLAEQRAERADVAAQRRLFGVEVAGFELGEAVGPAFGVHREGGVRNEDGVDNEDIDRLCLRAVVGTRQVVPAR